MKFRQKRFVEAVRRNDKLAIEIWDETCRFLAIGIGNVITILAPEAVIIGGGVATAAGDLLFVPLRQLLPEYVSMIPANKINILPAELGNESGVCGALVLAKKAYSNVYGKICTSDKKINSTRRDFLKIAAAGTSCLTFADSIFGQISSEKKYKGNACLHRNLHFGQK